MDTAAEDEGHRELPDGCHCQPPAEFEGIGAHETMLVQAARQSWSALPVADTMAAVEAGMLADAEDKAASADGERPHSAGNQAGEERPGPGATVAAEVGDAVATVQRREPPLTVAAPVDWGYGPNTPERGHACSSESALVSRRQACRGP
ncbi:MAG: hypothetical protein ABIZ05_03860 [Pseudonocardiaceae bacterium]